MKNRSGGSKCFQADKFEPVRAVDCCEGFPTRLGHAVFGFQKLHRSIAWRKNFGKMLLVTYSEKVGSTRTHCHFLMSRQAATRLANLLLEATGEKW